MPRQPDPDLHERILNAAQKLWKKGAEKTLTMRAVAQAAGTNTPAVYRRFRNRDDILRALLRRIQQDVGDALRPCRSPEEVCQRYLEYALSHSHEYELFYTNAYQLSPAVRSGRRSPLREHRPAMALVEEKLAERLGGSPAEHTCLSLALWTVAHGTAMLLISKAIPEEHVSELRAAFTAAVETLISNPSGLPVRK
ncbi:MAG TPA: TetR/AcrR family transcriptional regulator [Terriglobales bacterium]|nr:TetR/AcrR family transcriptional regulator [Terriglobales bacterium]